MEARHLLLAFTLLTHSLTSAMWWIGGAWMGLSRRAARHWMLASLANGLALALITVLPEAVAGGLRTSVATTLAVLGAISLRRGLQFFLKLPRTDQAHWLQGGGVVLVNAAFLLPTGWHQASVVLGCALICWILGASAREAFQPLRIEFNVITAWVHSAVMGLAAIAFGLTAVGNLAPGWHDLWGVWSPATTQFAVVFTCVALSILMSFVLGYIVVMRLVRRLEHLSHHDALTGLLNRRAIEYLLDREDQRLQRFSDPFSVLLVDIDHFKRINDRLGHAAGDVVLCEVARVLQAQAREVDRVARYGGEEFCILLPHTLHEGALQAAERLREAVSQINISWNDETVTVSISTGLACAAEPGESLQSLLNRADEALYRAKAEGRNRVISAAQRPLRHKTA